MVQRIYNFRTSEEHEDTKRKDSPVHPLTQEQ